MTTPLKIRIWDKKRKRMIYLQEQIMITYNAHGKVKLVLGVPFHDDFQKGEIKDYDVMLAIGSQGKNGRDIYKGDIVRDYYADSLGERIFEVVWNNDRWDLRSKEGRRYWDHHCISVSWGDVEVIGNIYENPGLLS